MNNFIFYSPTEFVFGRDTQKQAGELVAKFGGKKVLLVYGSGSVVRSGLLDTVKTSLCKQGLEFSELKDIKPNPTDDRVYEGIDLVRKEKIDFLLAVGGGSVIDTAKAIALGVEYDGDFWDFYSNKAIPTKAMPVGVVLTIPAAGSEGSGNSVITKIDGLHKISVRYPMVSRPKFAIMNPELTFTLPWFQTACGAVDMICHIQERYFSNTTTATVTDGIAESIMRNVIKCALKLKENPNDYDARANIMWASTLAHNGLCGNGKVEDWSSHRLEHEISAIYGVAHGAGLAVIVPAWMKFTAAKNPFKMAQFAENVMGIERADKDDKQMADEGIDALISFYHELGMTTSLRELTKTDSPDIDAMVKSLNGNMGNKLGAYVEMTMDDCRKIYESSL